MYHTQYENLARARTAQRERVARGRRTSLRVAMDARHARRHGQR